MTFSPIASAKDRFYMLGPGEGRPGNGIELRPHYEIKARFSDTNGHFTAYIATVKQAIPLHVHDWVDESAYVLEGAMELWMGDEFVVTEKGNWHQAPFGVPHAVRPISEVDPVLLCVQAPGGFEDFAELMLEHQESGNRDFTLPEMTAKLKKLGWTLLDGAFWDDKPKPRWSKDAERDAQ